MGSALEARVSGALVRRGSITRVNEYSDFALHLYLSEFEPGKFRATPFYENNLAAYSEILGTNERILGSLPLKTKIAIKKRLGEMETISFMENDIEKKQDYYFASVYFWRRFVVPTSNDLLGNSHSNADLRIVR